MNILNLKKTAVAASIAFISAIAATAANANVIYEFSNTGTAVYSGSTLSGTSGIFATATFTDVSAGVVQLTLNVLGNLPSSNYIDNWTFNLAAGGPGNGNAVNITSIEYVSGVTAKTVSAASSSSPLTSGKNNVTNGAATGFDLGFSFAGLSPKELDGGSFSTYKLTGTSAFDSSDFLTANGTGANAIYAAVHVNGGSTDSYFKALNTNGVATATAVPEPTTVALLGLGLLGFAAARRKAGKRAGV